MRPQYDPRVRQLSFEEQEATYPGLYTTAYYVKKANYPLPELNQEVFVHMNQLGPATVTGYYIENGWIGFYAKLHKPPEWWTRQVRNETKPSKKREDWLKQFPGVHQPGEVMLFPLDLMEKGPASGRKT
ncbi:MAG TPA: hypothetical protein EYN66_18455 [Myxococcales bacterium]|nr:hypothetical protein [Myxococcales bacterium]